MSNCSRRIKISRGLLLSGLFIALSFVSCKQDDSDIGLNLRNDNGVIDVDYTDTFDVIAYTVREDTLKSDSFSYAQVGAINDPLFGTKTTTLYSNLKLPETGYDFTGATLDSIVLTLLIQPNQLISNGAITANVELRYGDFTTPQHFEIWTTAESIDPGERIFSDKSISLDQKIGEYFGTVNYSDSTDFIYEDDTFRIAPNVTFTLDPQFGQDLLDQPTSTYATDEAFKEFVKGLAVVPKTDHLSPGDGSVFAVDLEQTISGITLYYNGGEAKSFIFAGRASRFQEYNIFDRTVPISEQLANPGQHYDEVYVSTFGGSKGRIEIKDILDLVKDGPVVINEARFEIPLKPGTFDENQFRPPFRMLLLQPEEATGLNQPILDQVFPNRGSNYYDGYYDADNQSYTFWFQRHLQQILDTYLETGEDVNRGFYLVIPSDFPLAASRAVFDTRQGDSEGMKLFIRYTKLYN
jgi:hypothetical protein